MIWREKIQKKKIFDPSSISFVGRVISQRASAIIVLPPTPSSKVALRERIRGHDERLPYCLFASASLIDELNYLPSYSPSQMPCALPDGDC